MGIVLPKGKRERVNQDYTKTRLYAWIDLLSKALSSIALVILGIVGWHLQSRIAENQRTTQDLDRQQRRYLPMLRSLMELEVALDDAEYWFRISGPNTPRSAEELHFRGTALRYAAYAVFVPDGDPKIHIHRPALERDLSQPMSLPLRESAIMLSDLMRIQSRLRRFSSQTLKFDPDTASIVADLRSGATVRLILSPEAMNTWRAWGGNSNATQTELTSPITMILLLQDVRFSVGQVAQNVVRRYPQLGSDYVAIRSEVLRGQKFFKGELPNRSEP